MTEIEKLINFSFEFVEVEYHQSDENGGGQLKVWFSHGCSEEETEKAMKIANLIASAPDLYDALIKVTERLDNPVYRLSEPSMRCETDFVLAQARTALKKARGE